MIHGSPSAISASVQSSAGLGNFLSSQGSSGTGVPPKAYLNMLFFNERFEFVAENSSILPVTTAGDGATPLVINPVKAPKNGYVYIYVSNASTQSVYFDNFSVSHERGRLIGEDHYYPYGLRIATLSSKSVSSSLNPEMTSYGYQGEYAEELNELDLEYNEFFLRLYDPQIGRFIQADPFDQFPSPYMGMGDDPVNMNDPSGGFAGMGVGASIAAGAAGGFIVGGAAALVTGHGDQAFAWALGGAVAGALIGLGSEINWSGLSSALPAVAKLSLNTSFSLGKYASTNDVLLGSPDEAALLWAITNAIHAGGKVEYASSIYSIQGSEDKVYGSTTPIPGERNSSNFHPENIPVGGKFMAGIHTHPVSNDFSYTRPDSPNMPSDEKTMSLTENEENDYYLVTPKGELLVRRGVKQIPGSMGSTPRSESLVLVSGIPTAANKNANLKIHFKNWQGPDGKPIKTLPPLIYKTVRLVKYLMKLLGW